MEAGSRNPFLFPDQAVLFVGPMAKWKYRAPCWKMLKNFKVPAVHETGPLKLTTHPQSQPWPCHAACGPWASVVYCPVFHSRARTSHSCLSLCTLCFLQCLDYSGCSFFFFFFFLNTVFQKGILGWSRPPAKAVAIMTVVMRRMTWVPAPRHTLCIPPPPSLHSDVDPETFLLPTEPPSCCYLYLVPAGQFCWTYFPISKVHGLLWHLAAP